MFMNQNSNDQELGTRLAEAMHVIETPGASDTEVQGAVKTLQDEMIPQLEAIITGEGAKSAGGDRVYAAQAVEQLGRARRYVNEGRERLGKAA